MIKKRDTFEELEESPYTLSLLGVLVGLEVLENNSKSDCETDNTIDSAQEK